jgi:hypothetical protein
MLGLAAMLSLPGTLHADSTYRFRILEARAPIGIEWSVTSVSQDWEIEVVFDPALCEISCTYRLKRNTTLLLPPMTTIRVYTGEGSPTTLVVDPAGVRFPGAFDAAGVSWEPASLPGRRIGPPALIGTADVAFVNALSNSGCPRFGIPASPCISLPLRI